MVDYTSPAYHGPHLLQAPHQCRDICCLYTVQPIPLYLMLSSMLMVWMLPLSITSMLEKVARWHESGRIFGWNQAPSTKRQATNTTSHNRDIHAFAEHTIGLTWLILSWWYPCATAVAICHPEVCRKGAVWRWALSFVDSQRYWSSHILLTQFPLAVTSHLQDIRVNSD